MRNRPRPRLRLFEMGVGFQWDSPEHRFDPEVTDILITILYSYHNTRDDAIDYYNKVLEVFNAESN